MTTINLAGKDPVTRGRLLSQHVQEHGALEVVCDARPAGSGVDVRVTTVDGSVYVVVDGHVLVRIASAERVETIAHWKAK